MKFKTPLVGLGYNESSNCANSSRPTEQSIKETSCFHLVIILLLAEPYDDFFVLKAIFYPSTPLP